MIPSGAIVLSQIAALHDLQVDPNQLVHESGSDSFDITSIFIASKKLGLTAKVIRQNWGQVKNAQLPAIAIGNDGEFFILARVDEDPIAAPTVAMKKVKTATDKLRFLVQHPYQAPEIISLEIFLQRCNGELIYFTSKATFQGSYAKFDFTWFIPAVIKYRKSFGEVLLLSLILQLIALATPLFFQVVMDKVLVNNAKQTLVVMTIGLFVVTIFEVALTFLRTFLMGQTSSKIDVELGSNLFGHLLHLPISYFETRRVGDSVARVRELENIRSFLTGNTLTVILDILFSVIFLGIMFWYSAILTIIVLVSIPMYALVSFFFTPILQKRLEHKFNVGAENQSFLVETVSAVQTVKSMAIEPRWQQRWDGQLAAYVVASLSTQNVANLAGNAISLINKFVTIAIIFFGSLRVTNGDMKVGELIAFNMLASQISTPILRLSQLWNDFQQVGISMSRMSDILDARTEVAGKKINLPALTGIILFDNVSFRYKPDSADILKEVNLLIQPGEVIGIVGRSGSGKSTLTKLIQRLYLPTEGRVLVDGQDLALIDTVGLRRQTGVVLQENMLFNRSIRDNISVADSAVELEKIIEVAKLAGAHEFICELPNGYDTMVGEHGTGLSGGQRQRITIARTLIRDPRILILDEATSALDYESEKIIQDNMQRICQGRTVIIIAHRLSAVRTANRIVVMDRGKITQIGSHKELMLDATGIYHHLHSLQHT